MAKYMLAGARRPPIALYNPQWTEMTALTAVARKLQREYDCPVFLIGAEGKGVTTPGWSLFLQQASALLLDWQQNGLFTVATERIPQVVQLWRRLGSQYRSSYSPLHLPIEATLSDSELSPPLNFEFYKMVKPFASERPIFCLQDAVIRLDIRSQKDIKDIEFNIRGTSFIWQGQGELARKLQQWRRVHIAFAVQPLYQGKWQGEVLDVTAARGC